MGFIEMILKKQRFSAIVFWLWYIILQEGRRRVSESIGNTGGQVVPRQDPAEFRRRHYGHRRPQRLREVQYFRRHPLGAGGAEREGTPGRQDGGRDFRRHGASEPGGLCAGDPGAGQYGADFPRHGGSRGLSNPAVLPERRKRVFYQPAGGAAQGRDGALSGHRPGSGGLFHYRAGQN